MGHCLFAVGADLGGTMFLFPCVNAELPHGVLGSQENGRGGQNIQGATGAGWEKCREPGAQEVIKGAGGTGKELGSRGNRAREQRNIIREQHKIS